MKIYVVAQPGPYRKALQKLLSLGLEKSNTDHEILEFDYETAVYQLGNLKEEDIVIIDLDIKYSRWISLTEKKLSLSCANRILLSNYPEKWLSSDCKPKYAKVLEKPFKVEDLLSAVYKLLTIEKGIKAMAKKNIKDVLIMEDDYHTTIIYTKALSRTGFSFDVARTMNEARDLLYSNVYQVFICDIHMGRECGTDLLAEFHGMLDNHGTQIVITSAYGNYRSRTKEVGADYFLEKPISLGTLFTLIDRLLDSTPQNAQVAKKYYRKSMRYSRREVNNR